MLWKHNHDAVIMDRQATINFVSGFKAPGLWCMTWRIWLTMPGRPEFRIAIGRFACYMKDLNVKYGFVSTYEKAVLRVFFHRQLSKNPRVPNRLSHLPVLRFRSWYAPIPTYITEIVPILGPYHLASITAHLNDGLHDCLEAERQWSAMPSLEFDGDMIRKRSKFCFLWWRNW